MAKLMPSKREENATVGVLVGRFQVPNLHEVHEELIKLVTENHPRTIIFLGLSPCKGTTNNPLDYKAREEMILEKFPRVTVAYIKDCRSDSVWSANLDKQISDILNPNDTVVLYGGRDSFIKHYTGRFKTQELESDRIISGSEIRKSVSRKTKASSDFREGVIWATMNRYPTTYTTVDVAIFNDDYTKMLMARKPDEKEYRFIGGFSTPESKCFEDDATREVHEEAGKIEVSPMEYLGSYFIDDWRYRSEKDKIKTLFFATKYVFGSPEGGDDVSEVRWVEVSNLYSEKKDDVNYTNKVAVVKEHWTLLQRAVEYSREKQKTS